MLKAIIFDMDGLMVDTEIISFQCYKDIIESYGFNFTKKEYIEDYPGKSVISSMNFIKNKYNIDFDTDEKINQFKILEEQYLLKNSVELKKGLIQLLKYLNIHYKSFLTLYFFVHSEGKFDNNKNIEPMIKKGMMLVKPSRIALK